MKKILAALKYDLSFIKSHTLQPKWFKILKVFFLLGFLWGYVALFGWGKMIIFAVSFFGLMLIVHFVYRAKTKRFSERWLDFIVFDENGDKKYKRIGMYYYGVILISVLFSLFVSQVVIK